jgi:hypothetical protein
MIRYDEDLVGYRRVSTRSQQGHLRRDDRDFLWQEANARSQNGNRGDEVQRAVSVDLIERLTYDLSSTQDRGIRLK